MYDKVTKRIHLTFYLMAFALKQKHFGAIEGAPDGSPEVTPTIEIEIKGIVEVITEMQLKMHMVMHLLVQKSARNDSIKRELEEALYVALESAPKISF